VHPHNDDAYASGRFVAGAADYVDFTHAGLSLRYQICKDNGSDSLAGKDVLLLSGYSFGAVSPCTSAGGWTAVADGHGTGRLEKFAPGKYQPETKARIEGKGDHLSQVVDVHKVVQ